jgi:UDP-glucose 4-epimerase
VQDCVDAVLLAMSRASGRVNVFNLGVDSYCEVRDSIGWICAALGVRPRVTYSDGERGWVGDIPFIYLETRRITELGWKPQLNIEQGVVRTLEYLRSNRWLLESRA